MDRLFTHGRNTVLWCSWGLASHSRAPIARRLGRAWWADDMITPRRAAHPGSCTAEGEATSVLAEDEVLRLLSLNAGMA